MDETDQTRIARPTVVDNVWLPLHSYQYNDALRIEGMVGSMHKLLDEDLQGHSLYKPSGNAQNGLIFSGCIIGHEVIAQIIGAFPLHRFEFIIFENTTVHEPSFFQKIWKPYFDVIYIECRGTCNIAGILHFVPMLKEIVFVVDNKNLQNIILCFKDIYAKTVRSQYGGGNITLKISGRWQTCDLTEEIAFPKFGESCFNRVNCVEIDFSGGELSILNSTIKSLCLNKALRKIKLNGVREFFRNKEGKLTETIFQFGSLFEEDNSLVDVDIVYKSKNGTASFVHRRLMLCRNKFSELKRLKYIASDDKIFSLKSIFNKENDDDNNNMLVDAMVEIVVSSQSLFELQLYKYSKDLDDNLKGLKLVNYFFFLNRGGIGHDGDRIVFINKIGEKGGIDGNIIRVISQFIGATTLKHEDLICEHYKEWSRNNGFGGKPIKFALVNREHPNRIYVFVIENIMMLVLFKTVYTQWNLYFGLRFGLIDGNPRINLVLSSTDRNDVRELLSNLNTMQKGLLDDVPWLYDFDKLELNPGLYIAQVMRQCGHYGLKLVVDDLTIVNWDMGNYFEYSLYI